MGRVFIAENGTLNLRSAPTRTTHVRDRANVVIMCGDEKRPREHRFLRREAVEGAGGKFWKLYYGCCICEAERVFGTETA